MDLIEKVRAAGIVGAGGAGFPTHVKIRCQAEYAIANGAECEPLLRADQQVMALYANELLEGMRAVMTETGAKKGVICLKSHYHEAIRALQKEIGGRKDISLLLMKSYYPAGDEQQIVYEVTGKVVPTGGLPLDVGAVVLNVSTLVNVARALKGIPVTEKCLTVGGEVKNPSTFTVPVGTPVSALVAAAGGPADRENYTLILGGPCMGPLSDDWETPVTKTMGGILVFKKSHPLIAKKMPNTSLDIKLIQAACSQCSFCTQLCPRNSLGLNVKPHKVMRAVENKSGTLLGDFNGIFSCSECGLCTYYACNFGLKPSVMMSGMKKTLAQQGVRAKKEVYGRPDGGLENKKVPVSRLIGRLGVGAYDVPAPLLESFPQVKKVRIPLKMHIGTPGVSLMKPGDTVAKGQLIAAVGEDALGANIHASISGSVVQVTKDFIEIEAQGGDQV
jgi:Na+-translocating ferredoxin:NAD+ oxidoreductase RnfC subunit